MIGQLPKSLLIGSKLYRINSDYRVALLIFEAMGDPDLTAAEKAIVAVQCLYTDDIPGDALQEAVKCAYWFLDGGDMPKETRAQVKLLDWQQDESIIFPAVNKVAGYETRAVDYLHWWSFLGMFNEIGEGLFATVVGIRLKRSKGKKLEKWEREFYNEHKSMICLRRQLSAEEKAEDELVKRIIRG
jgi:hypothetical protein